MDAEISRLLAGYPAFCSLPIQWGEQEQPESFGHRFARWWRTASAPPTPTTPSTPVFAESDEPEEVDERQRHAG